MITMSIECSSSTLRTSSSVLALKSVTSWTARPFRTSSKTMAFCLPTARSCSSCFPSFYEAQFSRLPPLVEPHSPPRLHRRVPLLRESRSDRAARYTTSLSSVEHPTLDKAECASVSSGGTLRLDPKGPHVQRYINTNTP